jgi:hypothetical protein
MIFFLLPLLAVSVTEIQISSHHKIKGDPLRAYSTLSQDYVGFTKGDFIKLKSSIETNKSLCDIVLDEAKDTCDQSIQQCFDTCSLQPEKENLIKSLKYDLKTVNEQLTAEQKKSRVLTYVSIGLGAVALSSSIYIVTK